MRYAAVAGDNDNLVRRISANKLLVVTSGFLLLGKARSLLSARGTLLCWRGQRDPADILFRKHPKHIKWIQITVQHRGFAMIIGHFVASTVVHLSIRIVRFLFRQVGRWRV